ncbi:MAG TPA: SRPBCC domain-containing protein [Bryobacteraceae bacterium]|jgi:uncharacterized protein YndB with AHSA1/START domain
MPAPAFKIIQEFDASPEKVFDAWLDPALIRRWMFAREEIFAVKLDPKPGGKFSIIETSSEGNVDHFGEYRKIERPSLLVFTLSVPLHFSGSTLVRVELSPRDGGCVMIFTQTGVSKEVTGEAWEEMFMFLAIVLKNTAA